MSTGAVTATLTYQHPRDFVFKNMRVAIARGGTQLYSAAVDSRFCKGCAPYLAPAGKAALGARDLDGDGEPEVTLDLWTGGAHCCYLLQVFHFDTATGSYAKVEQTFYDYGYKLRGANVFVSADGRFDYDFTSFAASGVPVQVWRYSGGVFTDVTRSYPALIRRDAAKWFRYYRKDARRHLDVKGFLTAWAADEFLLGHRRRAVKTLRRAVRRHEVRSDIFEKRKHFVRDVLRLLRRTGYAS